MNAEVAPCQWEYQIGPCEGISAGDQIWISRWIMERLSEKYNVFINWEPKPVKGINGSGCHTNYIRKYEKRWRFKFHIFSNRKIKIKTRRTYESIW